MDRTAATSYLTEQYRDLALDAKFDAPTITAAYNGAIDMALRRLEFDESELSTADVEQSDIIVYIALLDYFALRRFSKLYALKFDVTLPGPVQAQRSQAFDRIRALLKDAEMELANLGIDVGGTEGFQMGRITLDFLEPSMSSEF